MWKFRSFWFWLTTRDFSNRKLDILPPSGSPPLLNWISKYLPCKIWYFELWYNEFDTIKYNTATFALNEIEHIASRWTVELLGCITRIILIYRTSQLHYTHHFEKRHNTALWGLTYYVSKAIECKSVAFDFYPFDSRCSINQHLYISMPVT